MRARPSNALHGALDEQISWPAAVGAACVFAGGYSVNGRIDGKKKVYGVTRAGV
jgi:hypothetical protein